MYELKYNFANVNFFVVFLFLKTVFPILLRKYLLHENFKIYWLTYTHTGLVCVLICTV